MSYDVVIVGAGAAGCALAGRLSADPELRVLLLEAGPDERPDLVRQPSRWTEGAGSRYDYGYSTTEQQSANGMTSPLPRGRILGGSTAINAMIHALPRPQDLDSWGAGWSWSDLAASFDAIENHLGRRADGRRGSRATGPDSGAHPLCADFVTAAQQSGFSLSSEVSDATDERTGWFELSVRGSERLDAAEAYLRPVLSRPNLEVRPNVSVTAIALAGGRAIGLDLVGHGVTETLEISGELVLCAGAIDSPALLLRSGVGLRADLQKAGVVCRIDVPGVGMNFHDHPLVPVVWSSAVPVPAARRQLAESYLTVRSGLRRGQRLSVAFAHVAVPHPSIAPTSHGATALVGLYEPRSRGRLRLNPDDPTGQALIDPGYLTDPADLDALVAGVDIARTVSRAPALARWGLTELLPGPAAQDHDSIRAGVRSTVSGFGHAAGTCALAPGGVVDADLRVHGTTNIRVADASVMPTLPEVAPSVTVQAIGWHAAELIARSRSARRTQL